MLDLPIQILMVENEPDDVQLQERALRKGMGLRSYDLIVASTLDEALHLLGIAQFDIVLLDLGLPDAGGNRALLMILAKVPDACILVVSGTSDTDLAVSCVQLGAEAYLSKTDIEGPKGATLFSQQVLLVVERCKRRRPFRPPHDLDQRAAELANLVARRKLEVDEDRIQVLVVEDRPSDARFIQTNLGEDFRLVFASSMREAERICMEWVPDVVLEDLCLPDAFGLETVARAKKMVPGVPIVILSSYVSDDFRLGIVDDQVVEALNKGDVTAKAIIRVLQTTVQRQEAMAQSRLARVMGKVIERWRSRFRAHDEDTLFDRSV
jgi:CheY-like chemotaxis protein